jgi:hypothetical protein
MGKLKKGILGPVTGKVGSVVGGTWKGESYIRSLPSKSNKAATKAQLEQRQKFKLATELCSKFGIYVTVGYAAHAAKVTQHNLLVRQVLEECITGTYPELEVNYSLLKLSKGTLPPVVGSNVSSPSGNQLQLTWQFQDGTGNPSDQLMLAIYCPDCNEAFVNTTAGSREAGSLSIGLPAQFSGKQVHCFASFVAYDQLVQKAKPEAISNSSWIGSVEIV